jgi:hypothetical protein
LISLPLNPKNRREVLNIGGNSDRNSKDPDKPAVSFGGIEDNNKNKNKEEIFISVGVDFGMT